MITIQQLLESVDLDFEPRFITKSKTGHISIWREKPGEGIFIVFGKLRISEFENKNWTECIYEVPRKTAGKIKKLECYELVDKEFNPMGKFEPMCFMTLIETINSLVDAVNELKGE